MIPPFLSSELYLCSLFLIFLLFSPRGLLIYSCLFYLSPADVQWMRDVLAEQMDLERDREAELEAMYQEEAARVWQKREAEWERERIAREKLMEEVFKVREDQLDEKVAKVR